MNEVRITYDVGYLSFLVQKHIDRGDWARPLYCLKAVEMLEPDDERIDDWNNIIFQNLKGREPKGNRPESPIGKRLAIDSNIAISMITAVIGGYRFKEHEYFDDGFISTNDIIITPSVKSEVGSHIEYLKVKIGQFCKKDGRFDQDYIISELEKRYKAILDRYYHDLILEENDEVMKEIRGFYFQFVPTLIDILEDKMGHYVVSHKLRKLAQREDLLPEEGDMRLLSEVIVMKNNGETIDGILSLDKDLTFFSGDIYDKFGVEVYMPI